VHEHEILASEGDDSQRVLRSVVVERDVDRTLGRSKMSRRIFVEARGVVSKLRADALVGRT
jgi:hypothetical protein